MRCGDRTRHRMTAADRAGTIGRVSLIFRRSSLLSVAPDVSIDDVDRLVARSALLVQLLTLFSYARTVTIDHRRKVAHVETRFLWFLTSKRAIRFDQISHLSYAYSSLPTSFGFTGVKDRVEDFRVGFVMKDGSEHHLFTFSGEGQGATGIVGVLLEGDSLIDWAGTQEESSLSYVELLMKATGKGLSKERLPAHRLVPTAKKCDACGQSSIPSRGCCLYCGARVIPRT